MKPNFKSLILVGCLTFVQVFLQAQEASLEKPKNGGVAFVNVIPLDAPSEILLNNRSLKPEGFDKGSISSFVVFPGGGGSVSCKNGSLVSRPEAITISSKSSSIIITYLLETTSLNGQDKKQELRVLVVPCLSAEGSNQRVVLVGTEKPMTFNVNGIDVLLTPNQPSEPIKTSTIKIETSEKQEVAQYSLAEAGNFLVVITPDLKGGFLCTGIRDQMIVDP